MTIRIAMWSGPRNLSTAMMRAFENRPDAVVSDEPFYAAYLAATGADHPMRKEVLASQPTDWAEVAASMIGPAPDNALIWYQKQMSHHMVEGFGLDWTHECVNAFLIRDPMAVIASYVAKRDEVALADLGFVQQVALFDRVSDRIGTAPPVLDAADITAAPRSSLAALCTAIGIPFDPCMLRWPPGRRLSDGVWAPAWYGAVEQSTGFSPPGPPTYRSLNLHLQSVADAARPYYEQLRAHRLISR